MPRRLLPLAVAALWAMAALAPAAMADDGRRIEPSFVDLSDQAFPPGTVWPEDLTPRWESTGRSAAGIPATQAPALSFAGPRNDVNFSYDLPDHDMAVGPDHIVITTLHEWAVYYKDGSVAIPQQRLDDTFESTTNSYLEHGQVAYDHEADRFLVVAEDSYGYSNKGTYESNWILSVAQNPTGEWTRYVIDTGTSPLKHWWMVLGIDLGFDSRDGVFLAGNLYLVNYIGLDDYWTQPREYIGCGLIDLSKSEIYAGAEATVVARLLEYPNGEYTASVIPALTFGDSAYEYFAATRHKDGDKFSVWRRHTQTGAFELYDQADVGFVYNEPPDVAQDSSETVVRLLDNRLHNLQFVDGELTTSFMYSYTPPDADKPISASRRLRYDVASKTFLENDRVVFAEDVSTFSPSQVQTTSSCTIEAYGISGEGHDPSTAYRQVGSDIWQMAGVAGGSYERVGRWSGDVAMALDPVDDSVWILGEYANADQTWGTSIVQVYCDEDYGDDDDDTTDDDTADDDTTDDDTTDDDTADDDTTDDDTA
ncbi:hypothetical protein KDL45_11670, partial [bacterium]|nr:hypothetical protein [bacterium]